MAKQQIDIRETGHWQVEGYTQRVTTRQWKAMLLKGEDKILLHGRLRQLKAKYLGAGVYELSKKNL